MCETDGCFADGIIAATECTVGHRNLRVVDLGKIAATFVDTTTEQAVRLSPARHIRQRAQGFMAGESRYYFAQLQAYQLLPDGELLCMEHVVLNTPASKVLSRPGTRVECSLCGEEIINGRETYEQGLALCVSCAGNSYYRESFSIAALR